MDNHGSEIHSNTHSSYVPSEMERHLEFLDCTAAGKLLLGCSSLTGRYWVGSLWYYNDCENAPSVKKALTGLDCDNGVVDGGFLSSDGRHVVVALDNGSLEMLTLSHSDEPSFPFLEKIQSVQEHDDIISSMAWTLNRTEIITGSFDSSIVVTNADTFRLETRIDRAHEDLVLSVAGSPAHPHVIASAGNDGRVLTWDLRLENRKSLSCPYNEPDYWPTSLSYMSGSDDLLLAGNQKGQLLLFDLRVGSKQEPVFRHEESFTQTIHRVRFCPWSQDVCAVAADETKVCVFHIDRASGLTRRYLDERHGDFVRGLAWNEVTEQLLSCSWSQEVLRHSVSFV